MENTSYPWSYLPTLRSEIENATRPGSADLHAAMLTVQCLQSALIFATNAVTISAIARQPLLQSNTNHFIMSLCVADLLGCLLPFFTLSRYTVQIGSSPWQNLCFVQSLLLMLSLLGNMTNALCVAVDRYIFMAYPLRYDVVVTRPRVLMSVSGLWAVSVSVTVVVVIVTHVFGDNSMCHFMGLLSWGRFYLVILVQFVLLSGLTFALIGRYLLMSWKQGRQTGAWLGSVAVAGGENKEITNMMGVVVTIHVICYTPALVVGGFTTRNTAFVYNAESITSTILLLNSWLKPFVYFWKNNQFRQGYRQTLSDIATCNMMHTNTTVVSSLSVGRINS